MSEVEKEYQIKNEKGLYLLEIGEEDPKRNTINIQLEEEVLKKVSKQLNWYSSSFDCYLDGLIAPIPLQSPLKNETKLSDIALSSEKLKYQKIQLPSNIDEILEQDFYIVNKTKNSSMYPPVLSLKKRFIFE